MRGLGHGRGRPQRPGGAAEALVQQTHQELGVPGVGFPQHDAERVVSPLDDDLSARLDESLTQVGPRPALVPGSDDDRAGRLDKRAAAFLLSVEEREGSQLCGEEVSAFKTRGAVPGAQHDVGSVPDALADRHERPNLDERDVPGRHPLGCLDVIEERPSLAVELGVADPNQFLKRLLPLDALQRRHIAGAGQSDDDPEPLKTKVLEPGHIVVVLDRAAVTRIQVLERLPPVQPFLSQVTFDVVHGGLFASGQRDQNETETDP